MEYFGNATWNRAKPSVHKASLVMHEDVFQRLRQQLDLYQINYYAVVKNGKVKMVISQDDKENIQRLTDAQTVSQIHWLSETKPYVPPSINIIGNTNYHVIVNKSYIRGNPDILLQAAKQLEEQGISFSGRIYTHKNGTLTVNRTDQETVLRIYNQIAALWQEISRQATEQETVTISLPYLPQKELGAIVPFLNQSGITYSVHASANHYGVFSIVQKDANRFYQELIRAKTLSDIHKELQESGFSAQQEQLLEPLISFCANREIDGTLMLNYSEYLNPTYTEQQLLQISDLFMAYHMQSISDQLSPSNALHQELKQLKTQFEAEIKLRSIVTEHHYQDDQKDALLQAIQSGLPQEIFSKLDESYTVEELRHLIQVYQTYDMKQIQNFFSSHNNRLAEQVVSEGAVPSDVYDQIHSTFAVEKKLDKGEMVSIPDHIVTTNESLSKAYDKKEAKSTALTMEQTVSQKKPNEEINDFLNEIDVEEIRRNLESNGIVNGMVVNAEKLKNSPFIQKVATDVEQIERVQEQITKTSSAQKEQLSMFVDEKPHTESELASELQDEAAKAVKGNKKQRTFYFDMAKLRKSAQQIAKCTEKQNTKKEPQLGAYPFK